MALIRTYGRRRRGPFTIRLFRLTLRRRPLGARNRRLIARANRLRDRELEIANRRVIRIFARITEEAESYLRDNVPVKTGLLRRRVDIRGLNFGNRRRVSLFSDARNSNHKQYAKYVAGYDRALRQALVRAEGRIATERIRVTSYRISFVFGFVRRSVGFAPISSFINVRREETRLIFTLLSPKGTPTTIDTVTVSLL